jgi:hypothetical protein
MADAQDPANAADALQQLQQQLDALQMRHSALAASHEEALSLLQDSRAQLQAAQTTTAISKVFKPPSPPEFKGDGSDVDNWLFLVDEYLKFFGNLMTDAHRLMYATSLLRGNACTWYQTLLERARNLQPGNLYVSAFASYADFKHQLTTRFGDVNSTQRARDKLAVLKQTSSVLKYATDFSNLCLRIGHVDEAEKLDRFVRGLKPHIFQHLRVFPPATFDDAVQVADNLDRVTYAVTHVNTNRRNGNGTAPRAYTNTPATSGPTDMELGNVNAQRNADPSRTRLTDAMRAQLQAEGRCFYCRETGHTKADCPKRPRGPPLTNKKTTRRN